MITVVFLAFLVSGIVKGVVGFGLPAVSLAVLTIALDLKTAIALVIIPAIVTNLRQSYNGGHFRKIIITAWPFLLTSTICVWPGVMALARFSPYLLSSFLGVLLIAYGLSSLSGKKFMISKKHDIWIGPSLGLVAGLFAGMTGTASVPGIMYLQGIGLSRDALVQAMGILFTACTLMLGIAMQKHALISLDIAMLSSLALIPALIGMLAGEAFRKSVSENIFRKIFLSSLAVLGAYIIYDSISKF